MPKSTPGDLGCGEFGYAGVGAIVEFEAPDVRERRTCDLGYSQHHWQWSDEEGFTYYGACDNPDCISFGDDVEFDSKGVTAARKGLGTFRPNEDLDYCQIRCPACNWNFMPCKFVFRCCAVEINYCLKNALPTRLVFTTNDVERCEVFGSESVPLSTYTSLIITVDEVDVTQSEPPRLTSQNLENLTPGSGMLRSQPALNPYSGSVVMNPADIRYCQDSCASYFRCMRELDDTMRGLRQKRLDAFYHIPPIRVFKWEGRWHTEDNRRLWCFKQAGIEAIPVFEVPMSRIDPDKLTTENKGVEIRIRQSRQAPPMRPFGPQHGGRWERRVCQRMSPPSGSPTPDSA